MDSPRMDARRSTESDTGSSYAEHKAFNNAAEALANNKSSGEDVEEGAALEQDPEEELPPELEATGAGLERTTTGFLSPRIKDLRKKLAVEFFTNHAVLAILMLGVFSLYWGALYNRSHYYYKVNILAVIQDDGVLGDPIPQLVEQASGTWHIYNSSHFQERFKVSESEIDSHITKLVHDQHYWMSLNVKPNTTNALLSSLEDSDAQPFNSSQYFETVYESGRDPQNMHSSILPLMTAVEELYQYYYSTTLLPNILSRLSQSISNAPSANLAQAGVITFNQVDHRPFTDFTLLGPLQVGLIYTIMFTFFQLLLFSPMHVLFAQKLNKTHVLLYRYLIAFINYFILALFFCLVSLAFQVDFSKAFGRSGFVVAWMSSWLYMTAVGGANENMLSLLVAYAPRFPGFWMVFWVVMNISPTFFPMDLTADFYRYGYFMPVFNGVAIFRVIFLDVYPGNLGRNYGILCAWVVVNMSLFPFVMKLFVARKKKDALKAAAHNAEKTK
ncbi:LADA_0D00474g1_1 [Lachancea dasiensis]|uniref:LADA_0D00474g1_1 n=1 Tax=Lachancea dasiensis TaxID=1072105 RepID=A0A1G4J3G7_9SACH|nr:LADA_0D00474g1_1 [Lachancea dasiensis]